MDTAGWMRDLTSSVGRFRQLLRALSYFRPDAGRIALALGLLLLGIGLNLVKPWPLALLVDSILGSKPYPGWLPDEARAWGQPAQLTAIIAASLVAVPILLLSIKVFGRAMRVRGTAAQQAEGKVYALIHQGITALPLIQSHAREYHERQRFTTHTEEARQQKMAQQGLEVFYWGSISVILSACTLGVTWVGAHQVLAANLTVGELLVFLAYVAQLS